MSSVEPRREERRNEMNTDRVTQQLDKMVQTGRMTENEAQRIRDAESTPAFEKAQLAVRVRHAGEHLSAAVADSEVTREEADHQLQRLREGEHPKGLRARLRRQSKRDHT